MSRHHQAICTGWCGSDVSVTVTTYADDTAFQRRSVVSPPPPTNNHAVKWRSRRFISAALSRLLVVASLCVMSRVTERESVRTETHLSKNVTRPAFKTPIECLLDLRKNDLLWIFFFLLSKQSKTIWICRIDW